jgi:putative FmdB family regulatory protein
VPLYDYECRNCGHIVEVLHGVNASGPTACEQCGGPMRKLMSTPAIVFKGSGWAKKDARDARPKASKSATSNSKSDSSESSSSGSSSSTSSDGDSGAGKAAAEQTKSGDGAAKQGGTKESSASAAPD